MREDKERELMQELRGYYTHYPEGHAVLESHDQWRTAASVWRVVVKLSSELMDNHKTLNAMTDQLKREGVIGEQQKSQVDAEVR